MNKFLNDYLCCIHGHWNELIKYIIIDYFYTYMIFMENIKKRWELLNRSMISIVRVMY